MGSDDCKHCQNFVDCVWGSCVRPESNAALAEALRVYEESVAKAQQAYAVDQSATAYLDALVAAGVEYTKAAW